ncbi:DUF2243 domain-containing protein [Georgenia sp. SYP-B2076]|uniref:DUF2243 domain-containing protein n=1 Tax=Georgenia sp. SYP-B2076 TaxID=2495881 RepID=UPI001F0BB5C8|nr:DUF2243 domain-containing protein [Georgenia sp. SYP-B2076]
MTLASDGFLHAVELMMLVAGIFLVADLARRRGLAPAPAWGGFLLGVGGFQVFDGLVNHKVMGLHEIRYDVDLLPYDLPWNAVGVILPRRRADHLALGTRPGAGRRPTAPVTQRRSGGDRGGVRGGGGAVTSWWATVLVAAAPPLAYLGAVLARPRTLPVWSLWRTAAWMLGALLVSAA